MTNKERAKTTRYSASSKDLKSLTNFAYLEDLITAALDKVEKRVWMEAYAAGYKAGMERGQKEMRERAAKLTEACWQPEYKPHEDCGCPGY